MKDKTLEELFNIELENRKAYQLLSGIDDKKAKEYLEKSDEAINEIRKRSE